ncbi:uncharacterized protein MYCGRDRAFT_86044 [Zymoseptoria tritici IPO323]|uniref:hydroxymethylbilane synthase n=1 Tax=Zymoseptoria tritici (strain CBS 115943 / IPO323) TaxID=336722 RepID=F9XBW2_ZYMTI|nr:uncharacterized protein MYCGRDRAFT_86044 [Zymoseptoria tritici IPO323]EGP87130.1 hypothetical protein MYCGRDRAFT_86044 [Zymoseptoria tritici IPO323]
MLSQNIDRRTTEDAHVLTIGCRKSDLAAIQARLIVTTLQQCLGHPPSLDIKTHTVVGDADKHTPFVQLAKEIGGSDVGKSLWTTGLEADLLAGKSDILVHSLKDIKPARSLRLWMNCRRDRSLARVRRGGRLWDTRLSKLDAPSSPFACIILATAGLVRLKLEHRITYRLDSLRFPYAVGQGALGIEACEDAPGTIELVRCLDHAPSRWRAMAERSMLRHLQGGCSSPIGVWSEFEGEDILHLRATVLHIEGTSDVTAENVASVRSDAEADALGMAVASMLLQEGARSLLRPGVQ